MNGVGEISQAEQLSETLTVGAKSLAKRFAGTRGGYGGLVLRGIETGAATLVLTCGILLLTGTMASERLAGF